MSKNNAVVTGFMTISNSDMLHPTMKAKVLEASAGKERRFQKMLVDPNVLPAELKAQVLAFVETLEQAKAEEIDPKAKANINTGKVLINGRAYLSGYSRKTGEVREGAKKHSLTCAIAFHVQNVESFITDKKAEKAKVEDIDMLSSLMGEAL